MRLRSWALVIGVVACGSKEPPHVAPAPSASAAPKNEAERALTRDECESLAQWILEACHDRENHDRSTRAEGWCTDVEQRLERDKPWIAECVAHFRYMDAQCMRGTTYVRSMMDCESGVDRTHH